MWKTKLVVEKSGCKILWESIKINAIVIINIGLMNIFNMWKSMWKTFFQNLDYLFYICYS